MFSYSCRLKAWVYCAAGFLWAVGFGADFTSKAPSFIVITNGFAT
jgi:hypothetical protein